MKIKVLKIRLSEDFQADDEKFVNDFLQNHEVVKMASSLVAGTENYWSVMVYFEEAKQHLKESKSSKYSADADTELSSDEVKILDSLRLWRNEKAKEQNLPSYFIATNKELVSIAKFKPVKVEELKEIKGFGKHKIENYGEEIIEILETV
ncbi:HRDC domain-containing protein [Chryseobacterium taklimakanense]|uniref:Aldolase n=1 Tax=Chryseobacterium taklimakanense TaxID=536441 RepID=A0A3G8WM45_9FLAO|nr:HRDC domain-containing protein [Chryseobacterium taklimakanense]AZI20527.1 aldolase [Chryseobacterium taklimakanense]AZI22619.1 aldolase [Chryseobacterium taklimakanense]MCG7281378.1 HRDC domain-containing protein [Chryseobacterium taklimakanense]